MFPLTEETQVLVLISSTSIKVSPSFLLEESGSCQEERQRIKVEKQMLIHPTLLATYWAQEFQSFQTWEAKPSPLLSPGLPAASPVPYTGTPRCSFPWLFRTILVSSHSWTTGFHEDWCLNSPLAVGTVCGVCLATWGYLQWTNSSICLECIYKVPAETGIGKHTHFNSWRILRKYFVCF